MEMLVKKLLVVTNFVASLLGFLRSDNCILYCTTNFVKHPDFGCHMNSHIQGPFLRKEERGRWEQVEIDFQIAKTTVPLLPRVHSVYVPH